MSTNWVQDIESMHQKYGVGDWVEKHADNPDVLKQFLLFRYCFLQEEMIETLKAISNNDSEEVVDGLIDLCVVAIGTLEAYGIDVNKAWDEVLNANMNKTPGVKPGRPNPLGLPDLIKPAGWKAPNHEGNHGNLPIALQKSV